MASARIPLWIVEMWEDIRLSIANAPFGSLGFVWLDHSGFTKKACCGRVRGARGEGLRRRVERGRLRVMAGGRRAAVRREKTCLGLHVGTSETDRPETQAREDRAEHMDG